MISLRAGYNPCIRHIDLVKLSSFGHAYLDNQNITSDMLKGLHFPPKTERIDLSRNKIREMGIVRLNKCMWNALLLLMLTSAPF
jgi:hypothetical protein